MINGFMREIKTIGETAYASGRSRALMKKLRLLPRETPQVLETKVEKELKDLEKKLISFTPEVFKDDMKLLMLGKRELEELKIRFREYHIQKRRGEGLKLIKNSKFGKLMQENMTNSEIEFALDMGWFKKMRSTKLRQFIVILEKKYVKWYENRMNGKKTRFDPLEIIQTFVAKQPMGWAPIAKCYYLKLDQIKKRRVIAWGG